MSTRPDLQKIFRKIENLNTTILFCKNALENVFFKLLSIVSKYQYAKFIIGENLWWIVDVHHVCLVTFM